MNQSGFLALFLMICLGTLWLTACNNTPPKSPQSTDSTTTSNSTSCIEYIIAQDDSLGGVRNHACENISLAETILQYATAVEQLDYSNCPSGFEAAFRNHCKAWRQMIPFVEKYPDLRGEMHDLFDEFEVGKDTAEFRPLLKEVWDTWADVEGFIKK